MIIRDTNTNTKYNEFEIESKNEHRRSSIKEGNEG